MNIDPEIDAMMDEAREPAIWLRRSDQAVSASKLGGLPELPPRMSWPRHGKTQQPLHFLAQIDLGSLPRTPLVGARFPHSLPDAGVLFFFADMEEEMHWGFNEERGTHHDATRVIYGGSVGRPAEQPVDPPEIFHPFEKDKGSFSAGIRVYPEARLEAFLIDTFRGTEAYFQGGASREADRRTLKSIERATGQPVPVLSYSKSGKNALQTTQAYLYEYAPIAGKPAEARIKRHQMLGAATNVQGTAEGARAEGLVPLLQLDSDWGLHKAFQFCDMGMAQYWIRPDDLENGRFDRAWATTEGG